MGTSLAYATLAVGAAAAVRFALDPVLHDSAPLLIFVLAVFVSAARGGMKVGLYATVLSAAVAFFFFFSPRNRWVPSSAADIVHIVLFGAAGFLISWLLERLRTTERRALASEQAANAANERQGQFVAQVSHELRNPLNAILSALAVLRHRDETMQRKAYDVVARQAGHMARLLDDLLDSARIASGKLSVELQSADLLPIIEAAVEEANPSIRQRQQRLSIDVPVFTVVVNGDPTRLQQVFANVLINASKYTPVGGTIDVRLTCVEGQAELVVEDSGVGLTPEQMSRVFEPYVRIATDTPGLGLGLHIARYLVERHGGTIRAESAGPNRGTSIRIELPADVVLSPECQTATV